MFFDNYNNNGQPNSSPAQSNGYSTPSTGYRQTAAPAQQPAAPKYPNHPAAVDIDPQLAARAAREEDDEDFIEGWDDFPDEECNQKVNIKVFGVGGGGNNAVNRMKLNGEKNAELVVVNTDIPVLRSSPVRSKIAIGKKTTRGHGAGANPESGKLAAEESIELIKKKLEGVDMLYITAGMGGGTGTGASPVIAKAAKEMNILTVAVVTKPFEFEGGARMAVAEDGINKLRQYVDAVIVVPNERLNALSSKPLGIAEAFKAADEILIKGVQSICSLINDESYINLDFADVTTILKNSGDAHIGIGIASGENKAMLAAEQAINSPLLETSIKEADGMIISVIADENVVVNEISEAIKNIQKDAARNVRIIWGLKFDPNMGDNIEITVIATRSGGLREPDGNYAQAPEEEKMNVMNNVPPAPAPSMPSYQQQTMQPQPGVPSQNAYAPRPQPPVNTPNIPHAPVNEPVSVRPQAPKPLDYKFLNENEFKFIQSVANSTHNDKK